MRKVLPLITLLLAGLACNFPTTTIGPAAAGVPAQQAPVQPLDTPLGAGAPAPTLPPTRDPSLPLTSPTPDNFRDLPGVRGDYSEYVVQPNDFLNGIAQRFGVTPDALIAANNLANPNALEVGQVLRIPPQAAAGLGPDFKIIPDSELVNSPYALFFNVQAFVDNQPGYLKQHREQIGTRFFSGAQIVQRVASEYSLNPKLLLAVLEFQSGWLSEPHPSTASLDFPMGVTDSWRKGLYRQLSWAADRLNQGYYAWKAGDVAGWTLRDGLFVPAAPGINAGTAGVQAMLAQLYPEGTWRAAVSESGLFALYQRLFGYPFDLAIEPMLPANLAQPALQLPFEPGVPWVFSGGPHGGWGDGSAWAALDFAPRGDMLGCTVSPDWVVAAADGLIVRSDDGAVVQDLDSDGYEQTGWTVLYMHIAPENRVAVGTYLRAGERIGHPSCEGGLATAAHLHLARRYNGEWIPASGTLPFVLEGWVSVSDGVLYNGTLQRDGRSVEACQCRDPNHMLQR
ncbi:MAG: LysM peptidoglycan-binding domain-containing protein [Anaerolineales bacterium]|nr:LysM peptidoglycan-binding domain-containing protein [Anaerolineales bacterium]